MKHKNYWKLDNLGKIIADKYSGTEATIFFLSVLPEVIRKNNGLIKFKFPFYGLSVIKRYYCSEWVWLRKYQDICDDIVKFCKNKEGLEYFNSLKTTISERTESFLEYSFTKTKNLKNLDDFSLIESFWDYIDRYTLHFSYGIITFLFEGILSEELSNLLRKKFKNEATEILESLLSSDYKSFMIENEEFLLRIRQKNFDRRLIKKYINRFFYIKSGYRVAPLVTEKEVIRMAKQTDSKSSQTKKKTFSYRKMSLTQKEKVIIDLLKIATVIRDKRKQINLAGIYTMGRFLDEVSKRSNISKKLLDNLFWFELGDILLGDKKKLLKKIKNRKEASFVFIGNNAFYFDYLTIQEKENADSKASKIKSIKGVSASKGKATGKAKIVPGLSSFKKFNEGDVLVTEMTRPEFVPLIKKSIAVITDEGGLTCHAAIVAREMGKPCIVGTKIATKVIKDGNVVEVDANQGVIRILRKNK